MHSSLDVIVLSNTINDSIYKMNQDCFDSLFKSESEFDINVVLIESNKNANYKYSNRIQVITPTSSFSFNKFINIGLSYCKSDYIAICNNDLIFAKHWFSEIYKVSVSQPDILSFSPIDKSYSMMRRLARRHGDFHVGWRIRKDIAGWCIVIKKNLLDILNPFDNRFDFYFSDTDYGFTLKHNRIKHALVMKSKVKHLENVVSDQLKKDSSTKEFFEFTEKDKNSYPSFLDAEKYKWILEDDKMFKDFLVFYDKWGHPDFLSKVSALIILKNNGHLLKDTIESVLNQTWTNLEIIILDDCSTDNSYELAKSYESEIIKVHKNKDSQNIFLSAYEKATGDFIQYLNPGDIISRDKIEESMSSIDKYCDLDLVFSTQTFNAGSDRNVAKLKKHVYSTSFILRSVITKFNLSLSSFIIDRSLIDHLSKKTNLNTDSKFARNLISNTNQIYCERKGRVDCTEDSLIKLGLFKESYVIYK